MSSTDVLARVENSNTVKKSNSLVMNNMNNLIEEPFIIHPGAVSSILHLLTTISSEKSEHVTNPSQLIKLNIEK